VAIGTHDLAKCRGPFTYEALPPADISFVPLKQTQKFRADELMEVRHVSRCLPRGCVEAVMGLTGCFGAAEVQQQVVSCSADKLMSGMVLWLVRGPFTYEALPPADISFVPLKQAQKFRANELMEVRQAPRCVCECVCCLVVVVV
jgi:hypothetical protein